MSKFDFFLSNEPLLPAEAAVALDILSDDSSRGFDLPQKRERMGKITFNPQSCRIFSLASPTDGQWDYYLVIIPFTLHPAQEARYYREVTFFVELENTTALALDLFPKDITKAGYEVKSYTISDLWTFREASTTDQDRSVLHFTTLHPTIAAFGVGEYAFYWTFKCSEAQKEVPPETKQSLVVLRVPHGTTDVDGTIRYEVATAYRFPTLLQTKAGSVDPFAFRWELQSAPPFIRTIEPVQGQSFRQQTTRFDVCITCAMADEARMVLKEMSRQEGVIFKQGFSNDTNFEYRYTTIVNNQGEPLTIHVSWQPGYGPVEAGLHVSSLLREFGPRFVAMTGICAGDREETKLGDIVVAERAFFYDTGKIVLDKENQRVHKRDIEMRYPRSDILNFARIFDGWRSASATLARPPSLRMQRDWLLWQLLETGRSSVRDISARELQEHAPSWRDIVERLGALHDPLLTQEGAPVDRAQLRSRCYAEKDFPFRDPPEPGLHIKPMASGSMVRSDNPFKDIRESVRGAIAIDMEGAAFYRTVADFPSTGALVVKGVSDFADPDKDDTYHEYAAAVSADYILSFIKEYIVLHLMPG